MAHDLTADRSPLTAHADVAALRNARSPELNLETVHSAGRWAAPTWTTRATPRSR